MNSAMGDGGDGSRDWLQAGGGFDSCSATLRLFGDDLDPDVVTAAFGCAPTSACRKGDVFRGKVSTRVEPRGRWLLSIDHRTGADLDDVLNELLDRVTGELAVWRDLTVRFQTDLFCGLEMTIWNRGLTLSPRTLGRIAERGLELGLDVYHVADDAAT